MLWYNLRIKQPYPCWYFPFLSLQLAQYHMWKKKSTLHSYEDGFSFISLLLLINAPKEKYSVTATHKDAENGKTTEKETYVTTVAVSSWIQKTNRALEELANVCLPNKILFYEVRKKLILKGYCRLFVVTSVCIQNDVIPNSSSLFIF